MKQYKTHQLIFILTPFVFAFAFGLDIYIPVIPQMTEIFNTTPALIHLTLSLFLLITGVGQLFVGPLSDQFGRKKIFYISSFLFMAGSFFCAISGHIYALILSRALSSFGACGMLVTSFALVRDLYHEEESAKMYSLLNGAIGISPTFAPIIGGHLSHYFGWQSIFIFLSLIGLSALLVTKYFIHETLSLEKRVKINSSIFKRYKNIFSNKQFLIYASLAGFAEAVLFCFFSISPFIIIGLHGVATKDFGLYFAVFGAVIAFGGFCSAFLIQRFGLRNTIYIGITLMFLGGISMLSCNFVLVPCLKAFLIYQNFQQYAKLEYLFLIR